MTEQSPDSVEGHHPSLSSLGHGFKSHSGRSEGEERVGRSLSIVFGDDDRGEPRSSQSCPDSLNSINEVKK